MKPPTAFIPTAAPAIKAELYEGCTVALVGLIPEPGGIREISYVLDAGEAAVLAKQTAALARECPVRGPLVTIRPDRRAAFARN